MIGYILAFLFGYALRNTGPIEIQMWPSRPMTRREQYCMALAAGTLVIIILIFIAMWTGVGVFR